jgi:hypothetical protein
VGPARASPTFFLAAMVSPCDVAALDAFAAANGLSLPTSSVPEPASAVMMVMAGLGILRRRQRRN